MGRTHYQRLEARRRDLEDEVVVYALTRREPPEALLRALVKARVEAEAALAGETPRPAAGRPGLFDRLFGNPAVG